MRVPAKVKELHVELKRRRARRNLERAWSQTGTGRPATVPVPAERR